MHRRLRPLLLLFLLITLVGGYLAPYDPLSEFGSGWAAPSLAHPLGLDLIGRDVWSRLLHGGSRSLLTAAAAVLLAGIPGLLLGILAGAFPSRWVRGWLSILLNGWLAIPPLLTALVVLAVAGAGAWQVALAVGLALLPPFANVCRGFALQTNRQPYMLAATAIGVGRWRRLYAYVLPNVLPGALGFVGVCFAWALANGAGLHFLGFGGQPSAPEWGAMLAESRAIFRVAPQAALAPGLALMLLVGAANLIENRAG
jgi:peptide/nickel transport system permease protein